MLRLEASDRRLCLITELLERTIVLTVDECEELRTNASRPMVASGSPAVGWAIAFVRRLADRLA
jgi:hypothetical protein